MYFAKCTICIQLVAWQSGSIMTFLVTLFQLKNCQPVQASDIKRNKSFKSKSHRSKSSKRPKNWGFTEYGGGAGGSQGSGGPGGHQGGLVRSVTAKPVSKSKSFRAPATPTGGSSGSGSGQSGSYQQRYRKNRTADLSQLRLEDDAEPS